MNARLRLRIPKITDLKWTHVTHGLDRLANAGIDSILWNRMRFDNQFMQEVSNHMHEIHQTSPGERFTYRAERHYTRFELSDMLLDGRVSSLKYKVLDALLPANQELRQPELLENPYDLEWFVVKPGYRLDEEAARIEIASRGLTPCNTEEGLLFMWVNKRAVSDSVWVLDSFIDRDGVREFLSLGYTMSGSPNLSLGPMPVSAARFLAKRSPVVPEETEDD